MRIQWIVHVKDCVAKRLRHARQKTHEQGPHEFRMAADFCWVSELLQSGELDPTLLESRRIHHALLGSRDCHNPS